MIISLPVHTAVCSPRASGTFVMLVEVHVSSIQPAEGLAIAGSVLLAFFGCITQMEAIATANATARRRVRIYLTGIGLQLEIYFCLHRGSLPRSTAKRQLRSLGKTPRPENSEKTTCHIKLGSGGNAV